MATELSNIRRKDSVNMGQVITQLAPSFGIEPKALFTFLLKHPDKLEAFADKALDLKTFHGEFESTSRDFAAVGDQMSQHWVGLDEVAQWMRAHGMDPKKD